jgi:hypothetical protein
MHPRCTKNINKGRRGRSSRSGRYRACRRNASINSSLLGGNIVKDLCGQIYQRLTHSQRGIVARRLRSYLGVNVRCDIIERRHFTSNKSRMPPELTSGSLLRITRPAQSKSNP